MPRDFWHGSVSPKPLIIPKGTFRIFFENSRRYSQLKVHHHCWWHQWNMEKNFNQKSFFISFGHLWLVEIFSFKFTLSCQQFDIVPIVCRQCHWHRWQICRRIVDSSAKFAAGTVDTGDNSESPAELVAKLAGGNFRKNLKMTLILFSGAWGMMIHEKIWS